MTQFTATIRPTTTTTGYTKSPQTSKLDMDIYHSHNSDTQFTVYRDIPSLFTYRKVIQEIKQARSPSEIIEGKRTRRKYKLVIAQLKKRKNRFRYLMDDDGVLFKRLTFVEIVKHFVFGRDNAHLPPYDRYAGRRNMRRGFSLGIDLY
ncbi:hypothetical protein L486_05824 [Kwoniella mangroviensis CBS 10435]|uniref:Uncharacterized protein n=1 Tax=Kwoniella mangroviensis CBS 10435 TaxID=1331196 RepID=A0A1B9IMY3_9TREE|nr:hypothetical protein L486_05824 [Kwoniella mangroviensis CBS 10435]